MLKNRKYKGNAIVFLIALLVCSIVGCAPSGKKNTAAVETVGQGEVGEQTGDVQDTDIQEEGTPRTKPLSETDYALGKKAVGHNGNLYAFSLAPEGRKIMISYMGRYQDDILVVYQLENGENYMVRMNPLTMVEKARVELPVGIYMDGGIVVTSDGMLAVCNQMNGDIYLMNQELSEYDRMSLGRPDVMVKYIARDLSCLVYEDYETGENCSYNLETGEITQSDTADFSKLQVSDDFYIAYYNVGTLTEIMFGNVSGDDPKILALKYFEEYSFRYTDAESKIAVSRMEQVVGKQRQNVLSFYSLNTGRKQYELTVPLTDTDFISDYMTYIENEGIVMFEVQKEMSSTIYVWDLLAEKSACEDEDNYVYQWQGENSADETELEALRKQAKEIGERHSVEIYIGDAVKECTEDTYEYVPTDNTVRIRQALFTLNRALERYPHGMLAQLDDDYGGILKIYLAGDILPKDDMSIDTAVGVQNTLWEDTHLVLDINSVYDYESAIHHEIFHAIENHLNFTEEGYIDEEVWSSLNPPDFVYDNDYVENQGSYDFTYVSGDMENKVYFIDIYSKSFPNEDRARVMEYAMMEEKMDTLYFNGEHLRNKLKYLSGQIRLGFDTTGWPEVTDWEMWIQ